MWSQDQTGGNMLQDLSINKTTMGDFKRFVREKIVKYFDAKMEPIGGPGKTVEIDETLVSKPKDNVGRLNEQIWVFG